MSNDDNTDPDRIRGTQFILGEGDSSLYFNVISPLRILLSKENIRSRPSRTPHPELP